MSNNKLSQSFTVLVLIISALLLLSLIPEMNWLGMKIKRVDPLADIRVKPVPKVTTQKKSPTKKKKQPQPKPKEDDCKPGITCIEDYSADKRAFKYFLQALNEVGHKPVRIAFFGDSFIEGDIVCGSFRDTLQALYGGHGVGYVPIASDVAQYRTSIQHTFSNWETYSVVKKNEENIPLGTSGYCFIPKEGNEVEYRPAKKRRSAIFNSVRLFYSTDHETELTYTINDTLHLTATLPASEGLQQFKVPETGEQSIRFQFPPDSINLYGVSFEGQKGLYVDNFAMRGNSGMGFLQTTTEMNQQFNAFQNYKLIILQYGLNVVSEDDSTGYAWYVDRMVRAVNRLKESFPKCTILILSVSDRSSNQDGTFATIPYIPVMRDAQREIARKCGVAFWDLFTAMGGQNSIIKFVNAVPPLAAKDYTHLTFRGGKIIANKLAETILYERERYARKKKDRS